jgi:hypothetical protein
MRLNRNWLLDGAITRVYFERFRGDRGVYVRGAHMEERPDILRSVGRPCPLAAVKGHTFE